MASGASSLDSNESGVNIPHGFLPTNERSAVTLPTIPLPMDFESLTQNSGYDGQPSYQVVKQPTYDGMSSTYDSMNQSQYESHGKQVVQDGLKQQYELNALRRQHSETSRRCEHAMKELEYFRAQHRAAMGQLEVSTQESNNLRGKYGELITENQRLERELQRLKQDDVSNAGGGGGVVETGDTALMHTLQEYDALKEQYELLRKRYDEVLTTHNATSEQLQHLQEENARLKTQTHDVTQERNSAIRERNGLKQQCTAAIRQWDIALRERNNYSEALDKVKSQHEEAVREMNQAMSVRVKATKDIKRLTEERNAAMHEYSLIMSERDTVHKEMEKLSDDLARAVKRANSSEAELAAAQREKRALLLQAESLRREIASALHDRDRALKECSELTRNANNPNQTKARLDNSIYHHHGHGSSGSGKDGSNCEQGADASIDKLQGLVGMVLNPKHKERVDNLETANQELDRLRKSLDKLQAELTEAHQEAEVSKRRRDWAFSERDKIVLERESIRTLCDRLRKERDRAVSDLAEALRDSDDIKKQRNEASKELKELKEKYETELEKDGGNCRVHRSPVMHNHSRDSAIDADLQEWESEVVEVDLMDIPSGGDLGFELAGGRDDPYYPNDHGIYVVSIQKGSVAEGKLKVMDCIVEIAGSGPVCGNASSLQQALRDRGGRARLLVRRRRPRSRCLHTAQLNRANVADHGLQLQQGIYISKIIPGSLAAKEGNLAIGDRVLSINNRSMDGVKSATEAMMILNDRHYDTVSITTLKHISHSGSTNSDLSNRFSPIKESYGISHLHGKMVNSCSQTDDSWYQYGMTAGDQKVPTSHTFESPVSEIDRRLIYKISGNQGKSSHEKSHSSSGNHEKGTWDMIMDKIEAVTGRSKSKDKQNRQSVIPESDAIAELDSVLDSYHGKSSKESSVVNVLKRSKRQNKDGSNGSKSSKNNGGTWPKARSNVNYQENPTGTIVQPKAKKERLPLTVLLSPPTKLQQLEQQRSNRNSNPIPTGHLPLTQATTPSRHSVYKSIESSSNSNPSAMQIHFPKPVPLSIHNPFSPSNIVNFDKIRSLEKDKDGLPDFAEHDITPNRLSRNLNPSDDSLDFQPVTRDSKSPHSLDYLGTSKGPSSIEFVSSMSSMSKNPITMDYFKGHSGNNMLDFYRVKKSSPKTVSKYPSDSESLGPDSLTGGLTVGFTSTLPSHSRIQSQLYRAGGVPPFVNPHPHPHHLPPVSYTHPVSPTMSMTQSQSGESLGVGYECATFSSHSHNPSEIQPSMRGPRSNNSDHYHHHTYEGGTFPPKKENQRFRIPSNPSVTSKNSAGKVSTGSIERNSERGSPMPTFHVEVLSPGRGAHSKQLAHSNARNSLPEYCLGWHKPLPGELRRVHIDKSQQPLGIQISCPPESGGVFVSTVNEHSLASQVGLQVGDQLLEVCGINMRSATYKLAANVLRQCGNSITMLVQYSPDKYNDLEGSGSSSSGEPSGDEVSVSGSPTPRNSPGPQQSLRMEAPSADFNGNKPNQNSQESSEPRFLSIEMRKSSDLGISLVGGNSVGIFVHSVQIDSPAYNAGLRTGDQILEYNEADLRHATAEQAALELAKPADKVTVLVQYDIQRYHEIKDKPGDAFFVRAGFDRSVDLGSSGVDPQFDAYALWFKKDEVIFVDNTLFNGAPGLWRAWQLDHKGNKQQWGTIPSKFKVEELLRRSIGSLEGTADGTQSRRGHVRRSFFKRKKHRDPKELASFSNTNLGWWSDSGNLNEEFPLCSYQRVERLNYPCHRPVVVIGPLWECVVEKVVTDFPNEFCKAAPEPVQLTGAVLERALTLGKYLEPRMRGVYLECVSLQSIKDASEKGMHCILDVGVGAIEKLHKQQICPIVLQIKFKSTKQIKEVKDKHLSLEKVSGKAIKEMYEHSLKMETEFKPYVSAVIPAGVNIAYMCTQLKAAVDEEQGKALWVPSLQT